jgi:hypothetical protein
MKKKKKNEEKVILMDFMLKEVISSLEMHPITPIAAPTTLFPLLFL